MTEPAQINTTAGYEPSPLDWVRKQVETIVATGGAEGMTMRGVPVIMMTMHGARSGKVRKIPVMRVEHDGSYVAIASKGGSPEHPTWYFNLKAHPHITVQDGTRQIAMRAREIQGVERDTWWTRAVAIWPDYADYMQQTDRVIPVFVLEPDNS